MTRSQLLRAGLKHYRRSHAAVAAGVAVATAVLTGALLVGDSVRGSLRGLTLDRLGRVEQALVAQRPFRAALAAELAGAEGFADHFTESLPAWLLTGSVTHRPRGGDERRAASVAVVGAEPAFWGLGATDGPHRGAPPRGGVWLTEPLARELAAAAGDEVVLRLPKPGGLPGDSLLGDKADTTLGLRLRVERVLPAEGLARFGLAPSQRDPLTAFVALADVQRALDRPGSANAVLVAGRSGEAPGGPEADAWLAERLRPTLADYGLSVAPLPGGRGVQVASDRLTLPDAVVDAVERLWPGSQRVATYLANTLRVGDKSVPYSTVTGVESTAALGPLVDAGGAPVTLAEGEVALNTWAAEQLDAEPGDTVRLTYYLPESTHAEPAEAPPLRLSLKHVAALEGPDGSATWAADPSLTPTLEGVTDAESIGDWDLPFELVERVRPVDERYWDDRTTTPKAFVSLATAERLWGARWGAVSLVRIPAPAGEAGGDALAEGVGRRLRGALAPADLGFAFRPVLREGLAASSGTTPFDGLFFGFSLFLIASAVMLIALLFRLGVDQRAREVGLLSAVGWSSGALRGQLLREGLVVAALGAVVGVAGGVLYAWLMILGLTTLWVEAIAAPFLRLYAPPHTLLVGLALGLAASWGTMALALRGLTRRAPRSLLAGQTGASGGVDGRRSRGILGWLPWGLVAAALGLGVWGATLRGEAQAGAFFGSGAGLLGALLAGAHGWVTRRRAGVAAPCPFTLRGLASRNVARNPTRSLLTVALVAAASFLILAISAFRLPPTEAGTGGAVLVARSAQPVFADLNAPQGRLDLALPEADEALLDRFHVWAFRAHDGEDASCLNLYQTTQPRVLGVPAGFDAPFAWSAARTGAATPWGLLHAQRDAAAPIPVVLDFNTAMYSLKLYGGVGSRLVLRDGAGRDVELEVVGLLKNSLLQGDLLVGEADFLRLFPENAGRRFFLICPDVGAAEDAPPGAAEVDRLAAALEEGLSDYGFDAEDARRRLAGFLAVQNTYLSTFQTLGGLGLLLGVVGVAVAQLRSVEERRGELALLRASGFGVRRLGRLILSENLTLLGGGVALGAVAAAVALAPQALGGPQSLGHEARLPWIATAALLGAIVAVGLAVGASATRAALRAPIVPALRGD